MDVLVFISHTLTVNNEHWCVTVLLEKREKNNWYFRHNPLLGSLIVKKYWTVLFLLSTTEFTPISWASHSIVATCDLIFIPIQCRYVIFIATSYKSGHRDVRFSIKIPLSMLSGCDRNNSFPLTFVCDINHSTCISSLNSPTPNIRRWAIAVSSFAMKQVIKISQEKTIFIQ